MTSRHSSGHAVPIQAFLVLLMSTTCWRTSAATPASSPSAVGFRGYRRYHANDSYIGTLSPCSYEEKLCFRYNTLFQRKTGRCLESDDLCYYADRQEFLHGSGHLLASCPKYYDPCVGGKFRMAYDGRCYREEVVRGVLCGCRERPTPHFLGGEECRCSGASRVVVQQPQQEGRCRIPDLRFPDNKRGFLYEDPQPLSEDLSMQCTPAQADCFDRWLVAVRGHGDCHRLLERGPCAYDHVVALDRQALLASRMEATCVHARGGCPPGSKLMAFDGRCHKDRDISILSSGTVRMTVDGRHVINKFKFVSFILSSRPADRNGSLSTCILTHRQFHFNLRPQQVLMPPCAVNNRNLCHLFEVEAEAPMPELD